MRALFLDRSPPPRALAPLVFCLLALAAVAAFAYAQRLKREPLVLDRVVLGVELPKRGPGKGLRLYSSFTPNGDCKLDNGRIRFRITRSDTGDVQIIDRHENLIRTLASDRFLKRYTFFVFYWNGKDGKGKPAPAGPYKIRLILHDEDRTLIPTGFLRLHDVPPVSPSACGQKDGGAPAGGGSSPGGAESSNGADSSPEAKGRP